MGALDRGNAMVMRKDCGGRGCSVVVVGRLSGVNIWCCVFGGAAACAASHAARALVASSNMSVAQRLPEELLCLIVLKDKVCEQLGIPGFSYRGIAGSKLVGLGVAGAAGLAYCGCQPLSIPTRVCHCYWL